MGDLVTQCAKANTRIRKKMDLVAREGKKDKYAGGCIEIEVGIQNSDTKGKPDSEFELKDALVRCRRLGHRREAEVTPGGRQKCAVGLSASGRQLRPDEVPVV